MRVSVAGARERALSIGSVPSGSVSRLSLLPSIAAHIALGAGLLSIVWAAGFGLVLRVTRSDKASASALALGYAVGLCVVSPVVALFLVNPVLGAIALVLPAAGIVHLLRARWVFPSLVPAIGSALMAAPFVTVFAVLLGLYYHGPTAARNSSVFGDGMFYIAKFESAKISIHPYNDLLVSGEHFTLAQGAPTFLGAAFSWLPGFDPFLFHAVTLPVMFGLAMAAGIGSLALAAETWPPRPDRWVLALATIGAAAVVYPSWLVESPPVALAAPLAFAIFWLARSPLPISVFMIQGGLIAVALALTKFLGLVFLAAIVLVRVCMRNLQWDVPRSRSVASFVVAVALGAASVTAMAVDSGGALGLLRHFGFLPLDYVRNASTELHTGLHIPWGIAMLAGTLFVLAALVRSRELVLAGAFAITLVERWVEVGIDDISSVMFGLLAAVFVYLVNPQEFARQRTLLAAASACLLFASIGQELTGTYIGPALIVSLAATFFAATRHGLQVYPAQALLRDLSLFAAYALGMAIWLGGRHAAAVVLVWPAVLVGWAMLRLAHGRSRDAASIAAAVVLGGVAVAYVAARGVLPAESATITSDEYRFWHAVGRAVPKDALIFTSFTGESVSQRTGWNYYPAVAHRQLYIAGWADGPLNSDHSGLVRRLALNTRVMSGAVDPTRVAERRFHSFYAVADTAAHVPSAFVYVMKIGSYALYKISRGRA
jgi:hypothetical protein